MKDLTVTIETAEGLQRRLHVSVPKKQVSAHVIDHHEQEDGQVDQEKLLTVSFAHALEKAGLSQQTTQPEFKEVSVEDLVSYAAVFEVYPEITLPDFSTLKITRLIGIVDDEDVEGNLTLLRRQHSHWEVVERPAQTGDRVTIDLAGRVDGIDIDEKSVDGIIGDRDFMQGFDEGVLGASVGDELELDLKFPEDFYPSLAGKGTRFSVKVIKVEAHVLPEPDEEFVKNHGIESGDVEGLRRGIKANMEGQLAEAIRLKMVIGIMSDVFDLNPFEVPAALIEKEIIRLISDPDMEEEEGEHLLDLDPDNFRELARRRMAKTLLAAEIARQHDIELDEERLLKRTRSLIGEYPDTDRKLAWYYEDRKRMAWIESDVLESQVVEWILERANVTEEETTFESIMRNLVR